ncbi:immunoglobulin-like domain-containing protein [Terrisporobacter sp.]
MNKGYQNFKKRAGKLAIALTLVGSTAVGANAATTTGVTKTAVNMRTGAGTKYKVVTVVKADKTVSIVGEKGSWYKVKYNGKTGYISKSYVIKKNYTVKKCSEKYKLKVDLTVRKGPSTQYLKAGTLKKGTVVTVKGKTSNGWLQITYKGATRYISGSSKYVAKYTTPVKPSDDPKPVEKNNAPVISVNDTFTLVKGDKFEYKMLGATATDKEDGTIVLTDANFAGVVDTGKVGEYTVTVKVKDSKGLESTKVVKVVVKNSEINTAPSIAVDSELYVTQGDDFDNSMLKATAFDKEDGDLTDKIVYSGDTVNTKITGTYNVKLSVTDSKNVTVTKTVKVIVSHNSVPTIKTSLVGDTLVITKGGKYDRSMLKLTAYDKEDGDLTSKIQISDDKVDVNKIDTYDVVATVTDSKGIPAKLVIHVKVVKNLEPQITLGKTEMVIEQGDSINRQSILDALKVKAINPEDNSDITSKVDIYGFGSVDVNKPGTYTIKLSVEDEIGGVTGSALETATIKVVENQKPVINVQPKFIIMQGSNFKPSVDIKATATDTNLATGKVTDVSSSIKYEGAEYVNTNAPGPYTIYVKATDAKGLESVPVKIVVVVAQYTEPTITINNKDIKDGVLTVKAGATVDKDTFAAVAKDHKGNTLYIKYEGLDDVNTKRTGMYKVTLTAKDEFGRPATATIWVNVVE